MNNDQISENFSLLSKLMDIHGENSFKARSYASAAFSIDKLDVALSDIQREDIFSIKGIGGSTGQKIIELLEHGKMSALEEMIQRTPQGVIEMLNIKGIGPKKISTIWKEMQIESIGELLYACQENRLKLYKGFGEKTQQSIAETIEFYLNSQGSFLYSQAEELVPQIMGHLEKLFGAGNVLIVGNYLRQMEYIDELEFVVDSTNEEIRPKFQSAHPPELLEDADGYITYKLLNGLRLKLYSGKGDIEKRAFLRSGSGAFIEAFEKEFPEATYEKIRGTDDKAVFEEAGIAYIPAYLRETAAIIEKAKTGTIPQVIQPEDIKGIIHSHSNWSDGSNTLEEMSKAAIEKGLEYMVISDHSKSAFYANGLTEERIAAQQQQVDELNTRFKNFKIFKSIECDILNDGSLDYSNSILSTFDLVIASVHSNIKMTEEKAMMRLMNAIENPYTTILGHMTGRLLLSRKGYPVDHKKIIDACAANHVVIELNAHPRRLDIDWRYIDHALQKNVLISINPDAHFIAGFNDTRYGVLIAQKAGLTKEQNLSSFSLPQFEQFLIDRKKFKGIL